MLKPPLWCSKPLFWWFSHVQPPQVPSPSWNPCVTCLTMSLWPSPVRGCFQAMPYQRASNPVGMGWDILAMRSWFITNGIEGPKEDIQTGLLGCAFRLESCEPHNWGKEQNKETMKVFKNEGTSKSSSEGVLTLNYAFGPWCISILSEKQQISP